MGCRHGLGNGDAKIVEESDGDHVEDDGEQQRAAGSPLGDGVWRGLERAEDTHVAGNEIHPYEAVDKMMVPQQPS